MFLVGLEEAGGSEAWEVVAGMAQEKDSEEVSEWRSPESSIHPPTSFSLTTCNLYLEFSFCTKCTSLSNDLLACSFHNLHILLLMVTPLAPHLRSGADILGVLAGS